MRFFPGSLRLLTPWSLIDPTAWGVGSVGLVSVLCLLLFPTLSIAADVSLMSVSARFGLSGSSPIGEQDARRIFVSTMWLRRCCLPWQWYHSSGWGLSTRLVLSGGALTGANETNAIVTVVPVVAFGRQDERFSIDMGGGGALLSDYKFGYAELRRALPVRVDVRHESRVVRPGGGRLSLPALFRCDDIWKRRPWSRSPHVRIGLSVLRARFDVLSPLILSGFSKNRRIGLRSRKCCDPRTRSSRRRSALWSEE